DAQRRPDPETDEIVAPPENQSLVSVADAAAEFRVYPLDHDRYCAIGRSWPRISNRVVDLRALRWRNISHPAGGYLARRFGVSRRCFAGADGRQYCGVTRPAAGHS